ncbi:1428_t:CDS:2 [Dentiscutata erythropus]|uniref:1428_t:CDS:1 n=1 Tax=Dentiscutata erythropus TaxID=1348616 RepID=A0A9N8WTH1_9GLOM|nr:1428_t:CDS:2 [Dentiscutata erythropus]
MSPRNLQDVLSAVWQWGNPLKCLLLITIIVVWGYFLDICGGQPDYIPEIQKLMSLGTFIMTISFSLLTQITFSHIFAYVQGYFLLSEQGIPFQAIICEDSTPLRVLTACFIMLRQKHNNIPQLISYLGTLIIYIASIAIGTYAATKLATPYIFYETSINWVQAPTKGLYSSLNSAFTPENPFGKINVIQFNALSNWNTMTAVDGNEIAFMPTIFTSTTQLSKKFTDANGLVKWKLENGFNNINMLYLNSQCSANANAPCKFNVSETSYMKSNFNKENQTISWFFCSTEMIISSPISMQMDCNVTIKEGIFPLAIVEYPSIDKPRDEYLSQVLLRKNELSDAKEIKDDLFTILDQIEFNWADLISKNVAQQLYNSWDCEQNITCAQNAGAETTMCLGGNNPMFLIGLMIAIPLVLMIIELLPLLHRNKIWWLASDISNDSFSLMRSIKPCGNEWESVLPECTARPNEANCKKNVRFSTKENHVGLSSDFQN